MSDELDHCRRSATDYGLPIILLPGLSGDLRVFAPQVEAFPTLTIARWLSPLESENLADYARRLAQSLDPGCPCIIGGVSFGGIVAQEMASYIQARACVVISSTRDVRGLPASLRLVRPWATAIGRMPLRWAVRGGWRSAATTVPRLRRRSARLSAEELVFRQWALRALLTWQPASSLRCPVWQIHGACDSTFPASRTMALQIVPQAGHLLTVTHSKEVNELLRAAIRGCAV